MKKGGKERCENEGEFHWGRDGGHCHMVIQLVRDFVFKTKKKGLVGRSVFVSVVAMHGHTERVSMLAGVAENVKSTPDFYDAGMLF